MAPPPSSLSAWTPEQIAQGRQWVAAWRRAGPALERIRRQELRALDPYVAIVLLCGTASYREPPRAPRSTSGLVDQQRFFLKLRHR
jgi:hypothetical protein